MGFRAFIRCYSTMLNEYKVQLALYSLAFGDIKIMLPLVTVGEVRGARALVEVQANDALRRGLQQGH